MQPPHVCRLLDEASVHLSEGTKLDGEGDTESAVPHYSIVVEKLDIALMDMTGEKALSMYNWERRVIARRIEILRERNDCVPSQV